MHQYACFSHFKAAWTIPLQRGTRRTCWTLWFGPSTLVQLCDHKSWGFFSKCSLCGRNEFSPCKNGSCSITQPFSRPKVSKSHCVISQEPFLYSVRTLSDQSTSPLNAGCYSIYNVLRRIPHRLGVARCWSVLTQKERAAALIVNKVVTWQLRNGGSRGRWNFDKFAKIIFGSCFNVEWGSVWDTRRRRKWWGKMRTAWYSAFIVVSTDFRGWSKTRVFWVRSRNMRVVTLSTWLEQNSSFQWLYIVDRGQEDIPKQSNFVNNLVHYNSTQWLEFFRMTPATAQKLVEEIGPFFRERDGKWVHHWVLHSTFCVGNSCHRLCPYCRLWTNCCAFTGSDSDVVALCGPPREVWVTEWQIWFDEILLSQMCGWFVGHYCQQCLEETHILARCSQAKRNSGLLSVKIWIFWSDRKHWWYPHHYCATPGAILPTRLLQCAEKDLHNVVAGVSQQKSGPPMHLKIHIFHSCVNLCKNLDPPHSLEKSHCSLLCWFVQKSGPPKSKCCCVRWVCAILLAADCFGGPHYLINWCWSSRQGTWCSCVLNIWLVGSKWRACGQNHCKTRISHLGWWSLSHQELPVEGIPRWWSTYPISAQIQ